MRLDQAVDKALEMLADPKADRRRILQAFANTVLRVAAPIPAGGSCGGCGKPNPLCASCTVKHAIGNAAVNLVNGLGQEIANTQQPPASPRAPAPRRDPPRVYQGPINLGRVKTVDAEVRDAKRK